jgi:pimeloyl-ACP methyl ester carboxylesterase
MLAKIADLLILQPTRDPIDPEDKQRRWIDTETGGVEAWTVRTAERDRSKVDLLAIKFPGTGGRAERGGPHPFELWRELNVEVWTVNHAGYGGSAGGASLQNLAATCDSVWSHLVSNYPDVPIMLVGNSLGCLSALYLSARREAAGLYLRNPVPIHQMISTRPRYTWWNFGMSRLVANQIPTQLDAVENAGRSTCPLLMVRSQRDRVVPEKYQKQILENYAGHKTEFVIQGAEHHHAIAESQHDEYKRILNSMHEKWIQP